MHFDLHEIPFSRYGSFLALSRREPPRVETSGLYLRSVRGLSKPRECFRLEILHHGKPVEFREVIEPHLLRLEADGGFAEICFATRNVVRIRGEGLSLRLTTEALGQFDNALPRYGDRWQVVLYRQRVKLMVTSLQGHVEVDAPWEVARCSRLSLEFQPGPENVFETAIEDCPSEWTRKDYSLSFEKCVSRVSAEFHDWLKKCPRAPRNLAKTRELAAYLNWSCVVGPDGHLERPTMLMSKNKMTNCWSWDHCFNAIALSYENPQCAWDQFMTLFDHQNEDGALPDSINDAQETWSFCKPPIHGWTLKRMMERTDWIQTAQLREAYEPLCRWTDWWFNFRDDSENGLPQYNHGNDSGWDNATVFDDGVLPVEGPDLAAFLVFQMNVLSEVASKIGRKKEEKVWQLRSYELLQKMVDHMWRGDRFVAPSTHTDRLPDSSDCLLMFMPLILGSMLPREVREALVAGVRQSGRFFTKFGLATESPESPKYEADGYWRGPIWAPSTMLLVDGLAHSGQEGLAGEVARRFCKMCSNSGFAENFDALTGEGLRDLAYTWTSSVWLILANDFLAAG
jgi:glycogen debranching enzyme